MPLLSQLPQPLALLEIGASAGLCLLPDHYGYELGARRVGDGEPVFPCAVVGDECPPPARPPRVVWGAGIDLEPIDLDSPEAVRWLEALVWPEENDRLERLRQAISVARRDPPRVVRGHLVEALGPLAAQAPRDATLVVFHTAVLAYLTTEERERFRGDVMRLDGHWIAVERPAVIPAIRTPAELPFAEPHFLISVDAHPLAFCDPHGRWLQWLAA